MSVTEAQRDSMRAKKVTHWFMKIVSPDTTAILEMPKSDNDKLVWGFFPPDMLHGATAYIAGAINPLTQGLSVVALPSPGWKKK